MKNRALAILVAGVLLLSGTGSVAAAGKLGGAGGADEFRRPRSVQVHGGKVGGSLDRYDVQIEARD